ncbi:MAG: PAS domain-containing protein [Chloroflexota bacterium]|nr:PAS domain-containing protein [Dehalococcoidia bacterium]MDW8255207.1 PAS domain-containing protein [Chloroflexota bacterium]
MTISKGLTSYRHPSGLHDIAPAVEPIDSAFDRLIACAVRVLGVEVAALCHGERRRVIAQTDAPVLVDAVRQVEEWIGGSAAPVFLDDLSTARDAPMFEPLTAAGLRAVAGVPLSPGAGTVVGVLCVCSTLPRGWTDDDRAVLQGLAAAALSEIMLREAMARVAEQRDLMHRMLDRVTDGFVAIDRQWRFAYLNASAEQVIERPRDEVIGRVVWEVFPGAMTTLFGPAVRRAAERGETVIVEDQLPWSGRWLEARIFPSADGLSIYLHDTTDRRLAAQEREARAVAEAQRDGVILASREAAHLLNNDIALPMGLVELALLDSSLSARTRALLVDIGRSLERLHATIRRFQSIARVETKETPVGRALDLARSTEETAG